MLSVGFKHIPPPVSVRVFPLMSFLLIKGGRHPCGLHLKAAAPDLWAFQPGLSLP